MTSDDRVIAWILGLWAFYVALMMLMAVVGVVSWAVAAWGIGAMLLTGAPGIVMLIDEWTRYR